MKIILSDTSYFVNLQKALLPDAFLELPFEFLIPNTLFEDKLKFAEAQKRTLLHAGLKVVDIPGAAVVRAREVIIKNPHLSIHDGFAFVLAEAHKDCILLTEDQRLRALADSNGITVHGVLWIVDQIHKPDHTKEARHTALVKWNNDLAVRLSGQEIAAAIK